DAARGGAGVNGVKGPFGRVYALAWVVLGDLIGGDDFAEVELDLGDVADLGAGRQPALRQDDIADVAFASARAVFRGQTAGQDVGRQLSYRVDRLEGRMDVPGLAVKTEADYHLKGVAVGDHGDCRLVVLAAGRNVDVVVAEAEPGQLESVPIEV